MSKKNVHILTTNPFITNKCYHLTTQGCLKLSISKKKTLKKTRITCEAK